MGLIYADIAVFKCPCCRERIEVNRIQTFGERLFERKPFTCPHCENEAIWALTPFRVFNGGMLVFLLSFVLVCFAKAQFMAFPALFLGCFLIVLGILTQKLVPHHGEKTLSPISREPKIPSFDEKPEDSQRETAVPQKSLAVQILEAIKDEDCESIHRLFGEHPEQRDVFTFMGGQTWLGYAAQIGKLASIKTLMEIGLDLNAGDKREDSKPICSAACGDHYDVVKFFIENGAVLDVSLSIRNPLFAAIVGRSPQIVRLLLDAGIDSRARYNSRTMKNMDAVAFALMRGELECARIIAFQNTKGDKKAAKLALEEADLIAEENAR